MELGFSLPLGSQGLKWSEGDLECIFFTLNTNQATFVSDVLWYNSRNLKWDAMGCHYCRMDVGRTAGAYQDPKYWGGKHRRDVTPHQSDQNYWGGRAHDLKIGVTAPENKPLI